MIIPIAEHPANLSEPDLGATPLKLAGVPLIRMICWQRRGYIQDVGELHFVRKVERSRERLKAVMSEPELISQVIVEEKILS